MAADGELNRFGHLSTLTLERALYGELQLWRNPATMAHLGRCGRCRKDLYRLIDRDAEVRQRLRTSRPLRALR